MSCISRASLITNDPSLENVIKGLFSAKFFNEPISDTKLLTLGEKLELTTKQRVQFNTDVFRLTDTIQEKIQVARFYVSGSYGRRVTIGSTEIDLVVFLRNLDRLPPYAKSNEDLLPKLHASLATDFASIPDITVKPFVSPGCFLGDMKKPRVCSKQKNAQHRCCEEFISVRIGDANFRIFLAPALGKTSEEQRQATYRRMHQLYTTGGSTALSGWNPSLVERPSEAIAQAKPEIQAFIRVCQYWVQTNRIPSLSKYAVETLAYLVAKRMREADVASSLNENHNILSHSRQEIWSFDLFEAFKSFLSCCAHLRDVRRLCEIEPPASYFSPFTNYPIDKPLLTDNYNPYYNLLEALTPHDEQQLCSSALFTLQLLTFVESQKKTVTMEEVFTITPRVYREKFQLKCTSFLMTVFIVVVAVITVYVGRTGAKYDWDLTSTAQQFMEEFERDSHWLMENVGETWMMVQDFYREVLQRMLSSFPLKVLK